MLRQLRGFCSVLNLSEWCQRYQCGGLESPETTLTIGHISYNFYHVPHSCVGEQSSDRKLLLLTDSVRWGINELCCPLAYRDISLPFLNPEVNYHVYSSLPSNTFVKKLNHVHTFALFV
jgi:hypothetical protein